MTTVQESPAKTQYVYRFGDGHADGSAGMRNLLGGKGAGLAEMTNLGIPVPPGFTITTEVCTEFYKHGRNYPDGLKDQVADGVRFIEEMLGRNFGSANQPLLVSVRSGARVSMPGMMDTVLNLGLNDEVVEGLAQETGDARFAYDSYRRFVAMYGDVVLGLKGEAREADPFETLLEAKKKARGVELDTELTAGDLKELVGEFKAEIFKRLNVSFPENAWEQLWGAVGAVFGSWENPRAVTYRKMYEIPYDWGTAVTVQAMVFGNLGDDCATGVGFTRNPSTGENKFYGEYLVNAQGEDVVAGIRTPQPVTIAAKKKGETALEEVMPAAFAQLRDVHHTLERHYRDMQDLEFTIQQGRLWLLQTRSGKRTARAMMRIAVDLVKDGVIDRGEAIMRIEPDKLNELLHPTFDTEAERHVIATGLPASPGAAVGKVVFTAEDAVESAAAGEKVVLVRLETSPEDISGMKAAEGILTARGGMTSHAAVVARGMGRCCVAGCGALEMDYEQGLFTIRSESEEIIVVHEGDVISIDGGTGEVMLGAVAVVEGQVDEYFATMMDWVDQAKRLVVRTNADTPHDAEVGARFGAAGIGLCRTEHMFFEPDRILAMREMILSDDEAGRRHALAKILPMQREDFKGIFLAMHGLPVNIRLLDPPLHEFLPHTDEDVQEVADALGVPVEQVAMKNQMLAEFNPMLGHRGVRLGITYPEIYETQVRAIIEACCDLMEIGHIVHPEIMIPIVGIEEEFTRMRDLVVETADTVMRARRVEVRYSVGTMIELPRACMIADDIVRDHAEFFSFGTNDLTQTAFGISRDDSQRFIPDYIDKGVVEVDPFVRLDQKGVGGLMRIAIDKGRGVNPNLKIGICGEHGGDPSSVEFCHREGLNYVSCSPYRVPIARVAAAQAALRDKTSTGLVAQ